MLRKTENKGRSGQEKMRWLDNITVHESDQTLGASEGGSLACCNPWGHKESDTTEQLNNNMDGGRAGFPIVSWLVLNDGDRDQAQRWRSRLPSWAIFEPQ